ncbi:sensor histidine kinase [Bacillus cereus group sp. MYBK79-1]|uniref:sensor histidine kinase n=1 Tax=unclassified Bacillus cereus group TaxID=2750818 RepID=UPI003F78BA1F
MKKQLHFKVNARHVGQLGRELVTDYITALVEIIKNAYDADAEGVKVIFDGVKTENGRILIIDTGAGMSQQDVEEKWMVIGTNNKLRESHSPKGRKYAGKKGIGRFAVERLAERVKIYSFTEKEDPFKLTLNWNSYEEINIIALNQRFALLKHDPSDIDSAKYIKVHIDHILNSSNVSEEDKSYIQDALLKTNKMDYTIFLDNSELIDTLIDGLPPLLEKYKSLEVRIEDIQHELELLSPAEATDYVYDIESLQDQIEVKKEKPTGIIMVLENLRDNWTQRDLSKIQKELRLLVAPNFLDKNSFKPILIADEFSLQNDLIVNDILELSYAKVIASIDNRGQNITLSYQERLSGNNIEMVFPLDTPLRCGKSNLELFYFVRDAKYLSNEALNLTHARSILDEFCGVKIYRDGFHVKPYGTPGNDWLLLDQNKVKDPHGYLIGNNQVIGVISISEENNPLLIDATNRERIIENDAFFHLQKFVKFCMDFITDTRRKEYLQKQQEEALKQAEYKKRLEEEQRRKEEEQREEQRQRELEEQQQRLMEIVRNGPKAETIKRLASFTNEIKNKSEGEISFYKKRLMQERRLNEENQQEQKKIYDEALDGKERELSLYKNLATLGILTGAFGHETADIINRILVDIAYTKKWYPTDVLEERTGISAAYNKIFSDFQRVQGYSELIVNFVTKKKRSQMEIVDFQKTIEEIANNYNNIIKTQNIELEFDFSPFESTFKMYLIDFESIIINLLTNAFEALKQTPQKRVKILCQSTEDHYKIVFKDNGKGIKDGQGEFIFSPFMTTKDNGIGLGLSIVKDIISRYKGIITVGNSEDLGGAEFTILFPKEGN